jgi:hypothetical protein
MHPDDAQFLARFEAAAFGAAEYGHREHVKTVWLYLQDRGEEATGEAVAQGIRRLSQAHGAPERYHETLTRFWIAAIAAAQRERPAEDFGSFLAVNSYLLDKDLPSRHYSVERLGSEEARAGWVAPDLVPMAPSLL